MRRTLPPDVSTETFTEALSGFSKIVGPEYVFAGSALESYLDPYAIVDPERYAPSAAVAPDNVEQIQKILKIANDHRIPLWTISTGKNLAYGGPAPRLPGSMVLDLKRMNLRLSWHFCSQHRDIVQKVA